MPFFFNYCHSPLSIPSVFSLPGDGLSIHNGMQFSTPDRDNDRSPFKHCAQEHTGAWWYNDCMQSNLNGRYLRGNNPSMLGQGVVWFPWTGNSYSLKTAVMMIRPRI